MRTQILRKGYEMDYLIVFVEGIITFISPCILPMIPLYIAYFAGVKDNAEGSSTKTLMSAIGFVLGFTIVFTLLGTAAGSFGKIVKENMGLVSKVGGVLLVLFGLNYMDVLKIGLLQKTKRIKVDIKSFNFLSSVLFGIIFAFGWTPCVGAFLGSALMLAANGADAAKGMFMLFTYSIGLGIPFIISALLINQLKGTFDFIKRHYKMINYSSGFLLIIIGFAMITGYFNKLLSFFTIR